MRTPWTFKPDFDPLDFVIAILASPLHPVYNCPMPTENNIMAPAGFFWHRQFQHLLLLVGLVGGALYWGLPALGDGQWLGVPDTTWFWATLIVVIAHQVIVWIVFRGQLCFNLLTRLLGRWDMVVWGAIFLPFLALRLLLLLGLGLSDAGSLSQYRGLQIITGLLLLMPTFYGLYSVGRFFGLPRALGGDHFRQKYREMPLVREGAFQYTSNVMYGLIFLGLWSIALLSGSRAALAIALFQHAYIWVHMFTVEEPDMAVIYNPEKANRV